MITKTEILHVIDEIDLLNEEVDVETIFNILREAWNVPVDYQPPMSLEELQQLMAKGLPENWASREIMRMREE